MGMREAEGFVHGHRVLGKKKDGGRRSLVFKSQKRLMKTYPQICITESPHPA